MPAATRTEPTTLKAIPVAATNSRTSSSSEDALEDPQSFNTFDIISIGLFVFTLCASAIGIIIYIFFYKVWWAMAVVRGINYCMVFVLLIILILIIIIYWIL